MNYIKELLAKKFQIAILLLFSFCMMLQFIEPGKLFQQKRISEVHLSHIQKLFPKAKTFENHSGENLWFKVFDEKQRPIGTYTSTAFLKKQSIGFGGEVPMIIGLDSSQKIIGVTLLENAETESYVDKLQNLGFFKHWNNLSPSQAVNKNVDIVSGATMTSGAVINDLKIKLAQMSDVEINPSGFSFNARTIKPILASLALIFSLLSFFYPAKWSKHRVWLMLSNTIVLGCICGYFTSIQILYNWSINGISFTALPVMTIMIVITIFIHLVKSKNYYCMFLCPFGSTQELLGKIWKNKPKTPKKLHNILKNLRPIILIGIAFSLIIGESLPLSEMEPFSIFMLDSASHWIIGFASVILLISVISPRFWCKYLCPTGQFNHFLNAKLDK